MNLSMIINGIVAPPAAMVAKRTGQTTLPQLKFMNAIPDVIFVPSATVLALIAVKILRLMFIGNTTSKGATRSLVDHAMEPSSVDNIHNSTYQKLHQMNINTCPRAIIVPCVKKSNEMHEPILIKMYTILLFMLYILLLDYKQK